MASRGQHAPRCSQHAAKNLQEAENTRFPEVFARFCPGSPKPGGQRNGKRDDLRARSKTRRKLAERKLTATREQAENQPTASRKLEMSHDDGRKPQDAHVVSHWIAQEGTTSGTVVAGCLQIRKISPRYLQEAPNTHFPMVFHLPRWLQHGPKMAPRRHKTREDHRDTPRQLQEAPKARFSMPPKRLQDAVRREKIAKILQDSSKKPPKHAPTWPPNGSKMR